jgi:amidase
VGAVFQRFDVLVTPTLARLPVPTGSLQPTAAQELLLRVTGRLRAGRLLRALRVLEQTAEQVFEFIPWTPVFNITGQPAMSVPLAWHDGLPVGVHFVAGLGHDGLLYRLAGQLERVRPWFERLAPLAVSGES